MKFLKQWYMHYSIVKKSILDSVESMTNKPHSILSKGASRKRKGRKPRLMGPSICTVVDRTKVTCEGAVPWRLIEFTDLPPVTLVKVQRVPGTSRVKIIEVLSL